MNNDKTSPMGYHVGSHPTPNQRLRMWGFPPTMLKVMIAAVFRPLRLAVALALSCLLLLTGCHPTQFKTKGESDALHRTSYLTNYRIHRQPVAQISLWGA